MKRNSVHNPDVLSCLANLSNDEVFTPPEVVNDMLDLLPPKLFRSPDTKFLDPCAKSGVFLREIAKRLIAGLADEIPDLQERIDHIMHHQLYGVAITEMTALLARRSLYCSKDAQGKFAVSAFDTREGNIRFNPIQHTWKDGRCIYCGASRSQFDRGDELESHAYEFIHISKPKDLFNMKFDVIIGNPPYQMSTGGSVESQAIPIYDEFVTKARSLSPRYLLMIIPSRWMNGGFGLDEFRKDMLTDKHIRVLHDYMNAESCFPGIQLAGGVCYFLWDRDNAGPCRVVTHQDDDAISESIRYLLEDGLESFIRFNSAISIVHKVMAREEVSFSNIVSQRDPFGLNYFENGHETMFKLMSEKYTKGYCKIYSFGWQKDGIKYADKKYVTTNKEVIDKYKVFVSKANGAASSKAPYSVLSKPIVVGKNAICNMTYLLIGSFDREYEAENVAAYIKTKFFRFLVSLLKNTQNAYKKVYSLVPLQDFSKPWTDEELYKKYNLTQEEIDFIESMIKPME